MVGDAILREIIGADLFGAIAGPDLLLPVRSARAILLLILQLLELRHKELLRLLAVLLLAALGGTAHVDTGRLVDEADRRLDLVHVLPARAAGAREFDL